MWIHLANSPKDQVFLSCISHERSNLFHVPTTDLIPLLYCEETLCEQWFSLCDSASNCCVLGYHDTWSNPFIVDRAAERKSWYVSLCYSALADRLPQNEYPNPWTTEQDINPMDTIASVGWRIHLFPRDPHHWTVQGGPYGLRSSAGLQEVAALVERGRRCTDGEEMKSTLTSAETPHLPDGLTVNTYVNFSQDKSTISGSTSEFSQPHAICLFFFYVKQRCC